MNILSGIIINNVVAFLYSIHFDFDIRNMEATGERCIRECEDGFITIYRNVPRFVFTGGTLRCL